jgi:acetoin utilization deacetylase AcuC-like enzyme
MRINFFQFKIKKNKCGEEAGLGKNVNIAWNGNLIPPMGDPEYLAAFRCVVMPISKSFDPQIVLVSSGFDATEQHPNELGGYKVSPMCKSFALF